MIIFTKGTRAYAIFLWWDRHFAGLLGMRYGNRYSVSAQCYRSKCLLCRWLAVPMNWLQADHFRIATELEGLEQ